MYTSIVVHLPSANLYGSLTYSWINLSLYKRIDAKLKIYVHI